MKKFIVIIVLFLASIGFSRGAKISLSPATGTLKMLCPQNINIRLDHQGETSYGVRADISFNTSDIQTGNINFIWGSFYNTPLFSQFKTGPQRFVVNAYNTPSSLQTSGDIVIGQLQFQTDSVTVVSTQLGLYVHSFNSGDYSDDTSVLKNESTDILTEIEGGNYIFIPGTCDPDIQNPEDINYSPNINNTTKIQSASGLYVFLRDGNDYTKNQPGYINSLSLDDGNYQRNVADRASGIYTGNIIFQFVYPGNIQITLTGGNTHILLNGSGRTWDRKWRDYNTTITPAGILDFGIEQSMIFSGYIEDHAGLYKRFSYSFNNPLPPRITNPNPGNGAEEVLPRTNIEVDVRDDRAGVDPDTLRVRVFSGGCSGTLIGDFSGTQIQLQGIAGSANTPDYEIIIKSGSIYQGEEFVLPTPLVNICVQVNAQDNVGTTILPPNDRYSFLTRHSCGFYDCGHLLEISLPGQIQNIIYTNSILHVTGGASGYPLFFQTGLLNCGPINRTLITGDLTNPRYFTGTLLTISGGNAVLSGNRLIILPFYIAN